MYMHVWEGSGARTDLSPARPPGHSHPPPPPPTPRTSAGAGPRRRGACPGGRGRARGRSCPGRLRGVCGWVGERGWEAGVCVRVRGWTCRGGLRARPPPPPPPPPPELPAGARTRVDQLGVAAEIDLLELEDREMLEDVVLDWRGGEQGMGEACGGRAQPGVRPRRRRRGRRARPLLLPPTRPLCIPPPPHPHPRATHPPTRPPCAPSTWWWCAQSPGRSRRGGAAPPCPRADQSTPWTAP